MSQSEFSFSPIESELVFIKGRLLKARAITPLPPSVDTSNDEALEQRVREILFKPSSIAKTEDIATPEEVQALLQRFDILRKRVLEQGQIDRDEEVEQLLHENEAAFLGGDIPCIYILEIPGTPISCATNKNSVGGNKYGSFLDITISEGEPSIVDMNMRVEKNKAGNARLQIVFGFTDPSNNQGNYNSGITPLNDISGNDYKIAIFLFDTVIALTQTNPSM